MNRIRNAVAVLVVLACAETVESGVDVSIAPESRIPNIVFLLSPSSLFYGLSVLPCKSDDPLWVIGLEGENVAPPTRIVYGQPPPGYVARMPAQPLQPGCYRVVATGPSSLEFMVNPAARSSSGYRDGIEQISRIDPASSATRRSPT
jgi:hypothetical protein